MTLKERAQMDLTSVENAYQKNRQFHRAEFNQLGPMTEVLWKGGEKSQHDRFRQILRALPDLSGRRVLDVGCGFGDFLTYAESMGNSDIDYCGIDLCFEMIEECRKRRPGAEFRQCGVLEYEAEGAQYDFVIGSGIFALPNPDWQGYMVQTVRSMFNIATVGVAVNFLSDFSRSPSPESHYANPALTLDAVMREVTPWAAIIHDYRWNDFTVALFHEAQG